MFVGEYELTMPAGRCSDSLDASIISILNKVISPALISLVLSLLPIYVSLLPTTYINYQSSSSSSNFSLLDPLLLDPCDKLINDDRPSFHLIVITQIMLDSLTEIKQQVPHVSRHPTILPNQEFLPLR